MSEVQQEQLDINVIQSRLIEERDQLKHQINERKEQNLAVQDRNRSRGDLASDYFSRERQFALRSVEVQKLQQVEDALSRLREGTYGKCIECNGPIREERLLVLPSATLCMACQAK